MVEKSTSELDKVLNNTHSSDIGKFLESNSEYMVKEDAFFLYMRDLFKRNNVTQQDVFLYADIPERYGYKLLSGEKQTKQRDTILRICYAAGFSLAQTQKALKLYGMPELYSKIARDAVLMICFNERPGTIIEVNSFLKQNHLAPLRSSGTID